MGIHHTTGLSFALAAALLVGATAAHAAFTTENCLAKKRGAQGKLQQCRATEDAKALQGKPANVGKCTTKFQEKIATLNEKASDAGIRCRYRDNGNGTVTDYDTGLQWEKKNGVGGGANLANPHDVDNTYTWSISACAVTGCPNGTAFTNLLGELNFFTAAAGIAFTVTPFAGHADWRLPTLAELLTIVDLSATPGCGLGGPCIDAAFGPTAASVYWSSATDNGFDEAAWRVNFSTGLASFTNKTSGGDHYVRAVRGGL